MKTRISILKLTVITTMLLAMTGCGVSTSKITGYIENFDFENAYEYYIDNVEESKKKDDIDTEIKLSMGDIYDTLTDKYLAEELDSETLLYIEKLASKATFYDSSEYMDFLDNISLIDSSTSAYKEGMTMYEKNDYSSAIYYFGIVNEIDSVHYSEALDKISECKELLSEQKTESIRSLINNGKYQDAIQEINSLTDSALANELSTEIETAVTSDVDNKINSYFSDFDYNSAYNYVYDLYATYGFENLKSRMNDLENEFVQYSLSKSEEDVANNNYEAASAIIQQAMNSVGEDNNDLISVYNEYRSHLPVYITDMEYMSCVNEVKEQDNLKDNIGNMYHNGLFMGHNRSIMDGRWSGEGSADYYIQGKYVTFSGTVAVPSGHESSDYSAYFEVYGDGKLLYTSPVMEKGSFPESFTIDITDIKVLKISYPDSNKDARMATIYDGLLSPVEKTENE